MAVHDLPLTTSFLKFFCKVGLSIQTVSRMRFNRTDGGYSVYLSENVYGRDATSIMREYFQIGSDHIYHLQPSAFLHPFLKNISLLELRLAA